MGSVIFGQEAKAPAWFFGISYYGYTILPEDNILAENITTKDGTIGFQLGYTEYFNNHIGVLCDFEIQLGTVDRKYPDHHYESTVYGAQAFIGPRIRLGPVSFHALGGLSRLRINGEEAYTVTGGGSQIQYFGTGPSLLYAAHLNQLGSSGTRQVQGMPEFKRLVPAFNLGMGVDVNKVRFLFEYIPVYDTKFRNDFRVGVGIIFD